MEKNDKGFSLVELIIVIAIMAILVGILAPQLIKYIEKAKITSDRQLLDSVYDALVYAIVDPDVVSDPASDAIIGNMSNPMRLEDIMTTPTNRLCEEVLSTLGWDDVSQATYESFIESAHESNCTIYFVYNGDFENPVIMWITTTDATGGKDTSHAPTTVSDIGDCINIQ